MAVQVRHLDDKRLRGGTGEEVLMNGLCLAHNLTGEQMQMNCTVRPTRFGHVIDLHTMR